MEDGNTPVGGPLVSAEVNSRSEGLTALQKPNGGVRGIVAGDIVRRLVSRTVSQQMMEKVQVATAPFQFAMATKNSCECIAH